MSYNQLLIEDADQARIITLNRPDRRNALSRAMLEELHRATDVAEHTVILAAAGPVFCSGHDLREVRESSDTERAKLFDECAAFMLSLRDRPYAVIAEVQGMATAAGCQLVAACDLAIAAPSAQFATPGVRIGVFCTTPAVPLVRCIGMKRAMEMLLTGSPISAETALQWGLINRIAAASELRASSLEMARLIGQGSQRAIACGKRAVYESAAVSERIAYERGSSVMVENLASADAHEGISAFLEKRSPVWPPPQND
jgi:enoyl-CoA hydratase/carnithine racemase